MPYTANGYSAEDHLADLRAEADALDRRIGELETLYGWLDDAATPLLYDVMEAIDEELYGTPTTLHRGLYARWNALIGEAEAIESDLGWAEYFEDRAAARWAQAGGR